MDIAAHYGGRRHATEEKLAQAMFRNKLRATGCCAAGVCAGKFRFRSSP